MSATSLETARALIQAVDAELTGARSGLQILALPAYLTSGDFAKFYDQAQEVVLFAALTK